MANPAATKVFPGNLFDPSDRDVFYARYNLRPGEELDQVTITLRPEAIALGLTLIEDVDHGPFIADGTAIEMYFEIDPALRGSVAFDAAVLLPFEILATTTSTPFRRIEKTCAIRTQQQ
jgi:hypothetical protein